MAITLLIQIPHLLHKEHLGVNRGDKNYKWKSDEEMLKKPLGRPNKDEKITLS
jgi:hypothetical protein